MRSRPYLGLLVACAGVVIGSALGGCGGEAKPPPNKAPAHLRMIIQACDLMAYAKKRPPRDLEELKPYLQELAGKESLDDVLRSPNDGQPYEILWGVNMEHQTDYNALLAYEKVGVEGVRYVITVARVVKEMPEAEFKGTPRAVR